MKVSYKWLQEYIEETLPPVEKVADALTMHSFEIEGIESCGDDNILDVKILPNRSHDCLSHYGIASEIASVLNFKRKELLPVFEIPRTSNIKVSIDTKLCTRAVFVHIEGLKIGESPEWLQEKLQLLGQKPINSVVDITNYLMYVFGQPMHAFDGHTVAVDWRGNIALSIRNAKAKEKITLLNGKEYTLDSSVMVIADKDKALDVAGVMGGLDTGVTEKTTDIILSLSNFDAVSVRKTSKKLGIRTDASQRFENKISPVLIDRVLPYALKLISEIAEGSVVGGVDEYPKKQVQTVITVPFQKITEMLGVEIPPEKIVEILSRQNISVKSISLQDGRQAFGVYTPLERLDLTLPEDIVEEVGRLYGYEHISPAHISPASHVEINTPHYVSMIIRNTLIACGFSEIYTYSFVPQGYIEIENPLASDKNFLRKNLADAMAYSLEYNFKFLDLLGIKEVKMFEIGTVFNKEGESLHLSLGAKFPKSKQSHVSDEEVVKAIRAIEEALHVSIGDISVVGGIAEIDLQKILHEVKIPEKYPSFDASILPVEYKTISPYPFAVRDIAVFVPSAVNVEYVAEIIKKSLAPIVVRFSLFDTFTKDDKTSYAFRLVFQSSEKTLTDDEINAVLSPVYESLKSQEGFVIR